DSALNSLSLIEELGLSSKFIPIKMSHPSVQNRYIYADNAIHLVPSSLKGLLTKNSLLNRPLSSLIVNDFKAERVSKDDESIHSFIERRFGKDVAEKLAAPVLCGISGGD
ncbi:protoporphyrinogen oxidase-like, partial [Ceratina calcarata]